MPDLRTRFASFDAQPVPDLWAEIERRAAAGAPATRVTRPRPVWRGPDPTLDANMRLALIILLLGLLTVALLGASLVGGSLRDPVRRLMPPVEADAAVTKATAHPESSTEVEVLPAGVTPLPSCPDGPMTAVGPGALPEIGPVITATANGRIAMAGDSAVYSLDPSADPPIVFGMAPPLARFLYDPLISSIAWSPDGRWLAFVATGGVVYGSSPRQVYCQDLFVVPAVGGIAVNLTQHEAWTGVNDVAWSADGHWLVYARVDEADAAQIFDPPRPSPAPDPARDAIVAVRLGDDMTVAERRQVWDGHVSADLTWSADGELAFAGGDDGRLMLIGPGENVARGLAWRDITHAAWAPDGDRIMLIDGSGRLVIFNAHDERAPLTQELWVPEAIRGDRTVLTHKYIADPPRWMPNGRAIVMTITDESASGRDSEVVKVAADGDVASVDSLVVVHQAVPYPMAGPVVSPDGTLIAYFLDGVRGSDGGVWVMRADGTRQRRISAPLSLGMAGPADWQPLP